MFFSDPGSICGVKGGNAGVFGSQEGRTAGHRPRWGCAQLLGLRCVGPLDLCRLGGPGDGNRKKEADPVRVSFQGKKKEKKKKEGHNQLRPQNADIFTLGT